MFQFSAYVQIGPFSGQDTYLDREISIKGMYSGMMIHELSEAVFYLFILLPQFEASAGLMVKVRTAIGSLSY